MGIAPIKMPQLGESVTEGTVDHWIKKEGDFVKRDEPLVEVVTDKVNAEIPSPFEGRLVKISVAEGDTVSVGVELAQIETDGAGARVAEERSPTEERSTAAVDAAPSETPQGAPPPSAERAPRARFSPAVRRLAEEAGVDPTSVPGTGDGGRVTRDDVVAFIEKSRAADGGRPPAPAVAGPPGAGAAGPEATPALAPAAVGGDELVRISPMRKSIAAHMTRSLATSPHAWTLQEVDVTELVSYREGEKEGFSQRNGVPLTYLPFVIQAVCQALREFPWLNSSWTEDGILVRHQINMGIAVSVPDGLIVPVVKDADRLGFVDLARAAHELVDRARNRKLNPEDVQGGTFTLNNTGPTGSIASQPIINQPQAAILTTESIVRRPVVIGEGIAVRSIMNMCVSFDHRIVDGMMAGRFLAACKAGLEGWSPARVRI